jgi:hypothetical protein
MIPRLPATKRVAGIARRLPLAASFFALLASAAPAGADDEIPLRSGLPWASAAVASDVGFEAWRGRVLDARTVYFGVKTWLHARQSAAAIPAELAKGGKLIMAIGLVPESHRGQIAQCAAGAFDLDVQAIRDGILSRGGQGSILRLGWEFNRVSGSTYPWAAQGDGTTWRECFRRWVDIMNPVIDATTTPPTRKKNFTIVWNVANAGNFQHPIENLWPGDEYVDIVGSQFYDRCPPVADLAGFQRKLNVVDEWGNPAGPLAWLTFAKRHGKKWAVPEWGVGGPREICGVPGVDSGYFIRKMFEFFQEHASEMAFEAYFNADGGLDPNGGTHRLFDPRPYFPDAASPGYLDHVQRWNPLAAAIYRQLWARGAERDDLYWLRYAASYNDTVTLGTNPARARAHHEAIGQAKGRRLLFDPWSYLDRNPDLASILQGDPLAATRHYLRTGWREGRTWSAEKILWLRYIASYKGLILSFRANTARAELDYLTAAASAKRGRISFSPERYLARNPDVQALVGSDLEAATRHFITTGYSQQRTWSADAGYWLRYVASNPKLIPVLKTRPADAEMYYHAWGRDAGHKVTTFDPAAYLARNADVKASCKWDRVCATRHYIEIGHAAGNTWR